jgi:hypothetical protein
MSFNTTDFLITDSSIFYKQEIMPKTPVALMCEIVQEFEKGQRNECLTIQKKQENSKNLEYLNKLAKYATTVSENDLKEYERYFALLPSKLLNEIKQPVCVSMDKYKKKAFSFFGIGTHIGYVLRKLNYETIGDLNITLFGKSIHSIIDKLIVSYFDLVQHNGMYSLGTIYIFNKTPWTFYHELGHFLDSRNKTIQPAKKELLSLFWETKYGYIHKLKSNSLVHFLPSEYSDKSRSESFAELFASYILCGKIYRQLPEEYTLKKAYNIMRDKIFEGVEYE